MQGNYHNDLPSHQNSRIRAKNYRQRQPPAGAGQPHTGLRGVFEATHGTAPKYAGQNKVNPSSLMFSGAMMCDYIGWGEVSTQITAAFKKTVSEGIVTYDFARQMEGATEVSTSGFADALIERL